MNTMRVRIGTNPIGWSNDDMPALGGDTPLETCLAEARQAGHTGIEMGNKFPRKAAELKRVLAAHDLKLISGWYGSRLRERSVTDEIEAMRPHLDLLAALGCEAMVFAEVSGAVHTARGTSLSRRPVLGDDEWQRFGEALTRVADHTLDSGVRVAYHHHIGTVVETEAEIDRLMAATGEAVGLLLDTGHIVYAGGDPVAVARRHGQRVNHIHCKDVRPAILERARAEDWSFLDAVLEGVYTVPGDGAIAFEPVLSALNGAGYRGWLVVEAEQDPAKAHPLTYARMGHDHLREAVAAVGAEFAT